MTPPSAPDHGDAPSEAVDVLVVGAGITGLSCAHTLAAGGARVLVLEREDRIGGCIETVRVEGFVLECGPHTLRDTSGEVAEHLRSVGLGPSLIEIPSAGARRYIVRRGRMVPLPTSPSSFFSSPFLSVRGKLRLLAEPFVPVGTEQDPSLGGFVAHRLGAEVRDGPLDAFVGGVWAGDPDHVSTRAVAPALLAGVRARGSLLRHALASRRGRAPGRGARSPGPDRRMFTLRDGLGAWPVRLAEALGPGSVRLGASVEELERGPTGWIVASSGVDGERRIRARSVVLTGGAAETARLVRAHAPEVASALARTRSASLAVVHLGFRASDTRLPEGFGVLVPHAEGRDGLGILFVSALLPDRAPAGMVTTTSFFGGIRHPDRASRPEGALVESALREHRELLGVGATPVMTHVRYWPGAIPQYEGGWAGLTAALDDHAASASGLHVAGRFAGGVSVPDCWRRGRSVAERILAEDRIEPGSSSTHRRFA